MVCTYNFFTGDRLWRTQNSERAPLWCTLLIFTCVDLKCFIPPVVVHQITHYTQCFHYTIPSDWVIHNSQSGYMDRVGWHKSMSHFPSMCCSSPLNTQVLFYDGHDIHFDDRALDILRRHNIRSFILNKGDYVHDQPNNNGPNMKLNNFYDNAKMNWMRHHGTLKFTPAHMNYVPVETWEAFKLSYVTITQEYFRMTHISPPLPTRHWHQLTSLSWWY